MASIRAAPTLLLAGLAAIIGAASARPIAQAHTPTPLETWFPSIKIIATADRKAHMADVMQDLGVTAYSFAELTTAADVDSAAKGSFSFPGDPQHRRNNNELALFASHVSILRSLVGNTAAAETDRVLIFEDDIKRAADPQQVQQRVKSVMESFALATAGKAFEYMTLGRCWDYCLLQKNITDEVVQVYRPLCTHSFAVSKAGARKILAGCASPISADTTVDVCIAQLIQAEQIEAFAPRSGIFWQDRATFGSNLGSSDMYEECAPSVDEADQAWSQAFANGGPLAAALTRGPNGRRTTARTRASPAARTATVTAFPEFGREAAGSPTSTSTEPPFSLSAQQQEPAVSTSTTDAPATAASPEPAAASTTTLAFTRASALDAEGDPAPVAPAVAVGDASQAKLLLGVAAAGAGTQEGAANVGGGVAFGDSGTDASSSGSSDGAGAAVAGALAAFFLLAVLGVLAAAAAYRRRKLQASSARDGLANPQYAAPDAGTDFDVYSSAVGTVASQINARASQRASGKAKASTAASLAAFGPALDATVHEGAAQPSYDYVDGATASDAQPPHYATMESAEPDYGHITVVPGRS